MLDAASSEGDSGAEDRERAPTAGREPAPAAVPPSASPLDRPPTEAGTRATSEGGRNPLAVELGRRGGLKGGRARAAQLTPEQRRAIALKAAQARWAPKRPDAAGDPPEGSPAAQPAAGSLAAGAAAVFEAVAGAAMELERPAGGLDLVPDLPATSSPGPLGLTDWRRRISDLYSEVRRLAQLDPEEAWRLWRTVREALYRQHPLSPVPPERRSAFQARHFDYDPGLRFEVAVRPHQLGPRQAGPSAAIVLPNSGADMLAFERMGRVEVEIGGRARRLSLFWIAGYAGGLFLPFRDDTNGVETYGAGRYLLDTAKGADLGPGRIPGTIVLDFNFSYQPSCAFDGRWACPLAPPENRLGIAVRAGEAVS